MTALYLILTCLLMLGDEVVCTSSGLSCACTLAMHAFPTAVGPRAVCGSLSRGR